MTAPDPRVSEIEERLNKTTFGPWQHEPYGGQNQNGDYAGGYIIDGHGEWLLSDVSDADGPFIANAPSDVAYLLAELRKRDEALARVTEVLDNWQAEVPFQDAEETQRWYSLGKRHAAERIRAELKGAGA